MWEAYINSTGVLFLACKINAESYIIVSFLYYFCYERNVEVIVIKTFILSLNAVHSSRLSANRNNIDLK